jgi:hypothetical protein
VVWSLLLIAGSEGSTLISLAVSHPHTVGVFAAHVVAQFENLQLFPQLQFSLTVYPIFRNGVLLGEPPVRFMGLFPV